MRDKMHTGSTYREPYWEENRDQGTRITEFAYFFQLSDVHLQDLLDSTLSDDEVLERITADERLTFPTVEELRELLLSSVCSWRDQLNNNGKKNPRFPPPSQVNPAQLNDDVDIAVDDVELAGAEEVVANQPWTHRYDNVTTTATLTSQALTDAVLRMDAAEDVVPGEDLRIARGLVPTDPAGELAEALERGNDPEDNL
jgi:hypothetical protein